MQDNTTLYTTTQDKTITGQYNINQDEIIQDMATRYNTTQYKTTQYN